MAFGNGKTREGAFEPDAYATNVKASSWLPDSFHWGIQLNPNATGKWLPRSFIFERKMGLTWRSYT